MSHKSPITSPTAPPAANGRRRTIVLGIDPGTRIVGYGAVVDSGRGPRFLAAGVLRAAASLTVARRLGWIQGEMEALLRKVTPDVVVVERAFASRNMQSALRIGEGRGVILACAARCGADVIELAPAAAKKAVLGHGGADKTQVARMVAQILGLKDLPRALDATDALALALAHVERRAHGISSGAARRAGGLDRTLTPAAQARARATNHAPATHLEGTLRPWNKLLANKLFRNKRLRGNPKVPAFRPPPAARSPGRPRMVNSTRSRPVSASSCRG